MSNRIQGNNKISGCAALIGVLLLISICRIMSNSDNAPNMAVTRSPEAEINSEVKEAPPTTAAESTPPVPTIVARLKVNANFRSGPSTKHEIYRQLAAGTEVQLLVVTGEGEAKWYKTKVDGQEGWLSAVVLTANQDAVAQLDQEQQINSLASTPDVASNTSAETDADQAKVQACGDEIRAGVADAGETLQVVGTLLQEAKPDSTSWATAVRTETQKLRAQNEIADAKPFLETPAKCEKAYNLYLSGLYSLVEMADNIEQFLDTQNTRYLQKAVDQAKSGERYLGQSIAEVNLITQ